MILDTDRVEPVRGERPPGRRALVLLVVLAGTASGTSARAQAPAPALTVGRVARGIPAAQEPATRDLWRIALRDTRPAVRAAAARAITVTGSPLAEDVAAAMAGETDPAAFQEELRALVTLRAPVRDGELVAGLKTAEQAATAAVVLGRARGGEAFAHLASLRKAGLMETGDMVSAALAAGDYDGVAAAVLATGDAVTWGHVASAMIDGARAPDSTLESALRSPSADLREATLWALLVPATAGRKTAEPLQAAALAASGEPSPGEAAARELLSRALGRSAREVPQWLAALAASKAVPPPAVARNGRVLRLLSPVELAAWSTAVTGSPKGLSRLVKEAPGGPQLVVPSSWLFTLAGLPRGYAAAVLAETGCAPKNGEVATIEIAYGADGRPRKLGPLKDATDARCKEAVTLLAASGLAPGTFVVPANRPSGLVLLLDSEALACADTMVDVPRASPPARASEIREPKKTKNVLPQFPEDARRSGRRGAVILEGTVTPTGCMAGLRLLHAEDPVFVWPAMSAVSQWRYTPTLLDGQPVPVSMTVTVNFR
jgi:TonB family protein